MSKNQASFSFLRGIDAVLQTTRGLRPFNSDPIHRGLPGSRGWPNPCHRPYPRSGTTSAIALIAVSQRWASIPASGLNLGRPVPTAPGAIRPAPQNSSAAAKPWLDRLRSALRSGSRHGQSGSIHSGRPRVAARAREGAATSGDGVTLQIQAGFGLQNGDEVGGVHVGLVFLLFRGRGTGRCLSLALAEAIPRADSTQDRLQGTGTVVDAPPKTPAGKRPGTDWTTVLCPPLPGEGRNRVRKSISCCVRPFRPFGGTWTGRRKPLPAHGLSP